MMMSDENVLDQIPLLTSKPLDAGTACEILAELVFWRLGYLNGR